MAAVQRSAAGSTRQSHPPASPPRAMPNSTVASINANARLVPSLNSRRNRNHTTSSARTMAPAKKAAARSDAVRPDGTSSSIASSTGSALKSRATYSAPAAAATFIDAAMMPVPRIPKRSMSTASLSTAPASAPSVFQPYKRPRSCPKPVESLDSARTSTGSVAPIAIAGTTISTNAMPRRTALSASGCGRSMRKSGAKNAVRNGNRRTSARPLTPMETSSTAYSRAGRSLFGARLPASQLPSASPAMKLASTVLLAQTLFPNVSPASRNQSVSNSNADAPERKKTR